MKRHQEEFKIEKMAEILEVSRAGYYDFIKLKKSHRAIENEELEKEIKEIYKKKRGVYGSPRICNELRKRGKSCSRKRVAKLMKKEGLQARMKKKWKRSPEKKEKEIFANVLNQQFKVEKPNKVWVSDITYIWTQEGWLYLAIVMDLFSRKVIGLNMGEKPDTDLVAKALNQAICHRGVQGEIVHHSDRGSQYTSKEFKDLAISYGIRLSMSGKGNCYDNAVAESFFHTLKTELIQFERYRIREEAKTNIFEYIEVFYNRERSHSTIGYLSPEEFENTYREKNVRILNV